MARRGGRGGLANSFGSGNSSAGSTSGQGAVGGGGGGNNNNAQRRRAQARRQQRRQNNGGGGGGNAPPPETPGVANGFDMTTMTGSGSLTNPAGSGYVNNNPLDTGDGSDDFNDIENRRLATVGLLNQAGIDLNQSRAYGSSAVPFLEDMIQGWSDTFDGLSLTQSGAGNLTYENFMYGLPGAQALAENAPAPGVVPGTQDWRNQTWNPAMNAAIRRALARRTPTQRGQESTRWTGGNTTVAFG